MNLEELLKFVTEKGASDLHLKPTRPPMLRINGRLMPIEAEPLRPEKIREMILPILTPQQKATLEQSLSVDSGVWRARSGPVSRQYLHAARHTGGGLSPYSL